MRLKCLSWVALVTLLMGLGVALALQAAHATFIYPLADTATLSHADVYADVDALPARS